MTRSRVIRSVLFDLDDTLSTIDDQFMVDILHQCLCEFSSEDTNSAELKATAQKLRDYNHSSAFLSEVLSSHIDTASIEPFWDRVTELYGNNVYHGVLALTAGASQLIDFMLSNSMSYGLISNTHTSVGMKTLAVINANYKLDLSERILFLDQGNFRKPHKKAYELYVSHYNHTTPSCETAYVGNTVGDIQFALNSGMHPFFIAVPRETYLTLPKSQQEVLDQAVWISDLGEIIEYIDC